MEPNLTDQPGPDSRLYASTVTPSVMTINPSTAQRWLDYHDRDNNRTLSKTKLEEYVRAMKAGQWSVTGQGLSFDVNGKLVDGQHRLQAVVASGQTVQMLVTVGVDPETFQRVDTGRVRSTGDLLSITGLSSPGGYVVQAAALRLVALYQSGRTRPWPRANSPLGPSREDIVALHGQIGPAVGRHYREADRIARRIQAPRAPLMAALYIIEQWAERYDMTPAFAEWVAGFASGAGLNVGDGRLTIATWLTRGAKALSTSVRGEMTMLVVIRAWVAHVQREDWRNVSYKNVSSYMVTIPGVLPEALAAAREEAPPVAS